MIGPRPWGDICVRKTVPIVFECRQSWRQSCKVCKVGKVCIAALCNAIKLRRPKQILRQGQADSGGGSVGMQNGACLLCSLACVSTLVFSSYTWHCHILTPGAGLDCLDCPLEDIGFRKTHSCHLVGQTRSCLMWQGIASRQIMAAGVIEMFALAVSVKVEHFESASTCGQPDL